MSQLAEQTTSSASRLSHAVARLEEKGWVRRDKHPTDRRGSLAVLTDDGWAALRVAAPGHVAAVREVLFDRLAPGQVAQLRAITDRLAEHR
jgi:DNA-binding MarR family transcriptional regulator